VAVSNILANEELERRESERELLLSLNIEIAAVRNREELITVINRLLKKRLGFTHSVIALIDDDQTTASAFILDPESKTKNHPDYADAVKGKYPINDGFLKNAFSTPEPILYELDELYKTRKLPDYLKLNAESNISQAIMIRFAKGKHVFGFWIMFYDRKITLDKSKSNLIQGVTNQMSIAVTNIQSNEEIQRREEEKSRLLAFSNALSFVRDRVALSKQIRQQLKDMFAIDDYVIHALSEDKKRHRPILYDPDADFARHPGFKKMINTETDVHDGVFDLILSSEDPVSIDVDTWSHSSNRPTYSDAAKNYGLKRMTGVSIRLGEEPIAVLNFRQDHQNLSAIQMPLFKSICSQLAITVSNIIANDKISNQLNEINRFKQQLEDEKIYLTEEIETIQNHSEILGQSGEIRKVFRMVTQVASSDSTVLILGETGTGKELIARAIHNGSPRKGKLMVKVNCAALPANLIESELFGHERGSFTGATERRIGKFELANHGTLFLDEIGEMPLELQVKLLRALQEKEIERVGGATTIKTNVRIIAATNRNLEELMAEGRFRSDLYYRLNIFPIQLPPLRERREDIPLLTSHFIYRFAKKMGRKISTISNRAMQELLQYNWPGNIRELEHLIERSILLASGDTIQQIQLPSPSSNKTLPDKADMVIKTIDVNERDHILSILKYCKGKISGAGGAADLLGVPASTLHSKMKRLGIKKDHGI
jgi:transcriptional regulator with GAF, ATPase, and Fis domain